MQFGANNLDVGTLLCQHRSGLRPKTLSERIILIEEIDSLDGGLSLHIVGQSRHLDVGIGIEAEMPEVTFLVGENGVVGGIVQVENLTVRIAFVVLENEVRERKTNGGAVALDDEADPVVNRLLGCDKAFLRIVLVVERHDLESLAVGSAVQINLLGSVAKMLETAFSDRRTGSGQRIDEGDLDRFRPNRAGHKARYDTQSQPSLTKANLRHFPILPD